MHCWAPGCEVSGSRGGPEEEPFISGEGREGHGERPGKVLCGGPCRHEAGVPQQRTWGHGLAQALQSRETRQWEQDTVPHLPRPLQRRRSGAGLGLGD